MRNLNSRLFPLMACLAVAMSAAGETTDPSTTGASPSAEKPAEKTPGVGDLAKQLIRDGKGNKEVLEAVKAAFPEAKTSMSSINWYRNHLRGLGEDVKTAREISAQGKPTAEEKQAAKDKAKADKKADRDAKRAATKAEKDAAKAKAKAEAEAAKNASAKPEGENAGEADLNAALA